MLPPCIGCEASGMTIRTTLQYVAMLAGKFADWKNPGLKFVYQGFFGDGLKIFA
jgi:hypothetical protein